jgi:hypothetical protein
VNLEVVPEKAPRNKKEPHPPLKAALAFFAKPIGKHPEWTDTSGNVDDYPDAG